MEEERILSNVVLMLQTRQYTILQRTPTFLSEYDRASWFLPFPVTPSTPKTVLCQVLFWSDSDKKEEKLSPTTLETKLTELYNTKPRAIEHLILVTESPLKTLLRNKLQQALTSSKLPLRLEFLYKQFFLFPRLKPMLIAMSAPTLLTWEEGQTKHPERKEYQRWLASGKVCQWLGGLPGQVIEMKLRRANESPTYDWRIISNE